MKSSTETLIGAMQILAADIESADGVANAAISEAAERLAELQDQKNKAVNDYLWVLVHSEELEKALKEAHDYADRLVQHKNMVCLPKDLENLREANAGFAAENAQLKEKLKSMKHDDKRITVTVTNRHILNNELMLTLNWDASLDDWETAFKTILTHQTFGEDSVKEMFTSGIESEL